MIADDDSVVPLSQQPNRPLDTALRQQSIKAWYPYLDPWWVIVSFFVMGAIFIPTGEFIVTEAPSMPPYTSPCSPCSNNTGFKMQALSNQVVEIAVQYDDYSSSHPQCGIGRTANANKTCTISMNVTKDMEPPILVHYQIENFYQNHRKYIKSRDVYQVSLSIFRIESCPAPRD